MERIMEWRPHNLQGDSVCLSLGIFAFFLLRISYIHIHSYWICVFCVLGTIWEAFVDNMTSCSEPLQSAPVVNEDFAPRTYNTIIIFRKGWFVGKALDFWRANKVPSELEAQGESKHSCSGLFDSLPLMENCWWTRRLKWFAKGHKGSLERAGARNHISWFLLHCFPPPFSSWHNTKFRIWHSWLHTGAPWTQSLFKMFVESTFLCAFSSCCQSRSCQFCKIKAESDGEVEEKMTNMQVMEKTWSDVPGPGGRNSTVLELCLPCDLCGLCGLSISPPTLLCFPQQERRSQQTQRHQQMESQIPCMLACVHFRLLLCLQTAIFCQE